MSPYAAYILYLIDRAGRWRLILCLCRYNHSAWSKWAGTQLCLRARKTVGESSGAPHWHQRNYCRNSHRGSGTYCLQPSLAFRCRGKFVAPGKFFPPPYCHNVTNANANPNPNLNPSPNPNSNLNPTPNPNPNHKFNPILNLNPNPYCCVWE